MTYWMKTKMIIFLFSHLPHFIVLSKHIKITNLITESWSTVNCVAYCKKYNLFFIFFLDCDSVRKVLYIYIDNFGCLIITFTLTFTFIIVNYSLNCSELVGCYPKSVAKFQAPPKKVCNKCISGGIWMFEWKRLIMTFFFSLIDRIWLLLELTETPSSVDFSPIFITKCNTFLAGLQRNGKSCRLRWINYLRPGLKRGMFIKQEEETILTLHHMLGNK